jgi:hypothetical protein
MATLARDGPGNGSISCSTDVATDVAGSVGTGVAAIIVRGRSVATRCTGGMSWITGAGSVAEGVGDAISAWADADIVGVGSAIFGLTFVDA